MIKREYITAKRIVVSQDTLDEENILKENPRQSMVGDFNALTIKKGGHIVLDFGKELHGGIVISALGGIFSANEAQCEVPLQLTFGESVMEALSTLGEKNAGNNHAMRDFTVYVPVLSTQYFGSTGFRFVKIESPEYDVKLSCVQAFCEMEDLEYLGEFECDDELLNEIWKVGAYTVNLNIQEYIWDGIKRDRLVWAGDMNPEIHTIAAVFGSVDATKRSLDFLRDHTPANKWMNTITSYTMWWIINHRDLYMYTGDVDYLKEQKEYFCAVTKNIMNLLDESNEYNPSITSYVDWSAADKPQRWIGLRAVNILCLQAASEIADVLGEYELKAECLKKKEKIADYCTDGAEEIKQITALCGLSGLMDIQKAADIIENGGAKGFATFMGYYAIQVLAKAGRMDIAIDIIRDYWGGMLKMGATTFWEDFDIDWMPGSGPIDEIVPPGKKDIHGDFGKHCYTKFRHSLCHGWAGGPTAFMSQYILGVFPSEPGYKKIKIMPSLGSLSYAKGKIPTPYGVISIEHKSENGKISTSITKPDEIEIEEL